MHLVATRKFSVLMTTTKHHHHQQLQPQHQDQDQDQHQQATTTAISSSSTKYVWLSERLERVTHGCERIDFQDPAVLAVLEPDFYKCREIRRVFQEQDFQRYGYRSLLSCDSAGFQELIKEADFQFDTTRYPLAAAFTSMLGVDEGTLSILHCRYNRDLGRLKDRNEKRELLSGICDPERRKFFSEVYLQFVLDVVAPHVHSITGCKKLYFQAFPCIRVVRPKEFSIGVHCDSSYGFSQANINFYVNLTKIFGTNSLVLESIPGKEDWHTIEADYGSVKRFYGAQCSHFTTGNSTDATRVSLDFRVIVDRLWLPDHDHYCATPGYYVQCAVDAGTGRGVVMGPLPEPDWRMGFPFERSHK